MRKRSEASVQQGLLSAEEKTVPLPLGEGTPKVSESPRLPIESDLSAMCIALKERGYGKVRLSHVADWLPQVRHIVAMWLGGQIPETDIPEAIKSLKGEHEDVQAHVKAPEPPPETKADDSPRHAAMRVASRGLDSPVKAETIELVAGELLTPPDTITVTWGAEKFYPSAKGYNNFEVGMVSTTVHLKPGQDKLSVASAAYDELEKLGEEFRERKRVSFLRGLKGILSDPKDEK
jgi:hypothetical protein